MLHWAGGASLTAGPDLSFVHAVWPQAWTPSSEPPKTLPPQNWIQMSQLSGSSIYMLHIFTADQMMWKLARERKWEKCGVGICSGYSKETGSLSGVKLLSGVCMYPNTELIRPKSFTNVNNWPNNPKVIQGFKRCVCLHIKEAQLSMLFALCSPFKIGGINISCNSRPINTPHSSPGTWHVA